MLPTLHILATILQAILSIAITSILAIVTFLLGFFLSSFTTGLTLIFLNKLLPRGQEYNARFGASNEAANKLKFFIEALRLFFVSIFLMNLFAVWVRGDAFGGSSIEIAVRRSVAVEVFICCASLVLATLWRLFATRVVEDKQQVGERVAEGSEMDENASEHHMDGSDDAESINDGEVGQKLETQEEEVTSEADKEWATAMEFAR
ncbi:hypothetical protein CKM354_001085300 [Cercospora kikuchii]|uniref:Uncharacterized protein n=1 Tax=Cercospora kikuchii TaxID=84275 RepID=A0A9P3CXL6_9PEZI|nr:uncharacterized protein CKM354_001085300 [Cercospora kikuchii]GIZ47770.1 hypothetical protein CKM354_001085300 [Cercospora kikuchii]